ncbi:MAG: N-acetyltransferase [Alphaproteobacteria bacterium]|nr:N-acetyltransferase [Alphaproteobacteria bacterium]
MTLINHELMQAPAFPGLVTSPHLAVMEEKPTDYDARENLLDEAFGPHRFEKTVERLRADHRPATHLALVAMDDDELVGTLRLWPISAGEVPALLLGPLAVAKTHRSRGLGHRLMNEALIRAEAEGHRAILLVGDAPYYAPFGFSRRHTRNLILPGPVDEALFLGLELKESALREAKGLVRPVPALGLRTQRDDFEFLRAA